MGVERRGKPRLRVRFYTTTPHKPHWRAVLLDAEGTVVSMSPEGTEAEAEQYMKNYRRYGAWKPS